MAEPRQDNLTGNRWALAVLAAVGFLAYCNSFFVPFLFDDFDSIGANKHVTAPASLLDAASAPPQTSLSGRPAVSLSFAANYAVGGPRIWTYHAVNLAIHILAGWTLFGVIRLTLQIYESLSARNSAPAEFTWVAFIVSLLWLVHPLQTESVTYVVQRTEALMGLFFLFTLYAFIRSRQSAKPKRWMIASVFACALGMASKEVMVGAPIVVLLYDRTFLSQTFSRALNKRPIFYIALASTWVVLGALVIGGPRNQSAGYSAGISPIAYARTELRVIPHYLRLVLWPRPLVLDYNWPLVSRWSEVLVPGTLVAILIALTIAALYRRSPIGFISAAYFLILAPTSSVMPLLDVAFEHRMYLPLACVISLVVVGAWQFVRRTKILQFVPVLTAVLISTALVGLTIARNDIYQSAVSMWADVLLNVPDSPRAHLQYADALLDAGRFDESIVHFRRAIELEPKYDQAFEHLGNAYLRNASFSDHDFAEAVTFFQWAVEQHPNYTLGWLRLGQLREKRGEWAAAARAFESLVHLHSEVPEPHLELGRIYANLGRTADAAAQFREAIRLRPDYTEARSALQSVSGN